MVTTMQGNCQHNGEKRLVGRVALATVSGLCLVGISCLAASGVPITTPQLVSLMFRLI